MSVQCMHLLGSVFGLPAGCVKVSALLSSFDREYLHFFLSPSTRGREKRFSFHLWAQTPSGNATLHMNLYKIVIVDKKKAFTKQTIFFC